MMTYTGGNTMSWRVRVTTVVAAVLASLGLVAAPARAAVSTQDAQFLEQAHQANLAEINAGQLAQNPGHSQVVQSIGQRLITDHAMLDGAIQRTAAGLGVTMPHAPNPQQQATAAKLQQADGRAFDELFITTQLAGHAAVMAAIKTEQAKGTDQAVIAAATSAAPVVARHHQMLRVAASQLGIPTPQGS
jgi:predicted outer membrane protein